MGEIWIGLDLLSAYIGEEGAIAFCKEFGGVCT